MQFQPRLSIPKFFRQFGIEAPCTAILKTEAKLNIFLFIWNNDLQMEIKTDLGCVHVFDLNKYTSRCLASSPNCFSLRLLSQVILQAPYSRNIVPNPKI